KNSYSNTSNSNQKDDLHTALFFYGLSLPFTEKELRDKRKILMKKYHPDAGGNPKDAEKVNVYFDILKKFAS
ncbi:hypothetical protein RFY98_17340, partial [Acinetobacter baumannii]|nr:hypothetical protein [Acinetobacter baumannii]